MIQSAKKILQTATAIFRRKNQKRRSLWKKYDWAPKPIDHWPASIAYIHLWLETFGQHLTMTQCQDEFRNLSGCVTEILTASRIHILFFRKYFEKADMSHVSGELAAKVLWIEWRWISIIDGAFLPWKYVYKFSLGCHWGFKLRRT